MIRIINRLLRGLRKKAKLKVPAVSLTALREDIRVLSRESLERKLFNLTAAYNISRETSGSSGLENVLNILVDRIAQVLSVEIISLMLIGKNKSELLMKFAKGLDKEIVGKAKVKLGEGISGWVAQTGEPLLVRDINKDSRFVKRNKKYTTDSLLSAPLKIEDKVIGVINVNNKTSKEVFNEEDLETLKTIADLTAVTIANASLKEDARELDKLRSDFIANVSHELRTPLAALKESVGIVLEEIAGSITDKQRRLLKLATNNVDRLGRLIDDLLDFSKAEAEVRQMRRTLFNIVETAEAAITTLTPLAKQKGVEIKSSFLHKKIEIWGDEDKLTQVFTNFIDNAIKYNRQKGRVTVNLEDIDREVIISVSDTGVGIPEGDLDKIFDRFRRIESDFKEKAKGSGLGLWITREIVEKHGGRISVESQVGKGTKFTVTLPKNLRTRR